MKYFKNKETNAVFAYDETYPNDLPYIEQAIKNGWQEVAEPQPPVAAPAALETEIRNKRNQLLTDTDWVVTKSIEQQKPVPKEWKNYRQALRDITLQSGFPEQVEFPALP